MSVSEIPYNSPNIIPQIANMYQTKVSHEAAEKIGLGLHSHMPYIYKVGGAVCSSFPNNLPYPSRQDYIDDYHGGINEFYCGLKADPRKRRLGTMRECVDEGKVMLYGLKKIDPITARKVKLKINKLGDKQIDKLKIKVIGLLGRRRKLKRDIGNEKSKSAKKKLQEKLNKANQKIIEYNKKIKKGD